MPNVLFIVCGEHLLGLEMMPWTSFSLNILVVAGASLLRTKSPSDLNTFRLVYE